MAEPTGSNMPTSYDDNSVLLGDLISQRGFQLDSNINDTATTIPVFGNLSDVEVPCYLFFLSPFEIVFAETKAGDNKSFTNCIRGVRGTTTASHTAGDRFILVLSGVHVNMLRDAIIAAQKYQGLGGTDASKAASPARNEVFVATDTEKLYFAVQAGAWEWSGNRDDHADLDDLLDASAHSSIYHNDSRAQTWHDGLTGGHVTGGDSHDHGVASALGAGRVQADVAANRPSTPVYEREIYFETDTGDLYISKGTSGASDWVKIVGAPAGAVGAFSEDDITNLYSGACPPGWSRFTALDDRFAKGANTGETSGFSTGGATTHSHTYTISVAHEHNIPSTNVGTSTDGAHTHTARKGSGSGDTSLFPSNDVGDASGGTNSNPSHDHTLDLPSHEMVNTKRTTDDAAGVATGTAETVSSMPPFQEVIFCIKD